MTNKEALEVFRKRDVCYDNGCPDDMYTCVDCPNHYTEKEYSDAMDLAKKALEKQIPKMPVIGYAFPEKLREVMKRTDPEKAQTKTDCCPVCGRTLGVSQFVKTQTGLRFGDPHCKRCGQAIDWEDE